MKTNIEFKRIERVCLHNEKLRARGENRGIIYDFQIVADDVVIGHWLKDSSVGYRLRDRSMGAFASIRAAKQGEFDELTRKYFHLIPSAEQIRGREVAALAAKQREDEKRAEENRIYHIKESGVDLFDALVVAEEFMSGFEGDEMQEGMDVKLKQIRAAISKAKGDV